MKIRVIWGGAELSNFRERGGGGGVRTTLTGDRSPGRCNYPFVELSSHPAGPAQVGTKYVLSINLVLFAYPVDSLTPHPILPAHLAPSLFKWLLHKWPAMAHRVDVPQNLQTSHKW